MARSKLNRLQRQLYLASRTVGDVRAAEQGRLPEKLVKRWYHRKLVGVLRRGKVW